jgi:parallel beta-helix repeat protein
MIEECKGHGVIMDRDCYGNTVSANVISHNGGGVDLIDAHGSAVSANTFTINNAFGVRVSPGSGRITLTGNSFSNSYLGDGKVKRAANDMNAGGLILEGTTDVAVVGNVFAGVKPKALELKGDKSQRVNFSQNVLTDVASDHGQLENSLSTGNLE